MLTAGTHSIETLAQIATPARTSRVSPSPHAGGQSGRGLAQSAGPNAAWANTLAAG